MKRKIIAVIIAGTMLLSATGCGGNDTEQTQEITSEAEVVAEEGEEAFREVENIAETETTVEEVIEEKQDTRLEDGLERVSKVTQAYEELIKNNHELDLSLQNDVEKMLGDTFYLEGYNYKDGNDFFHNYAIYSTLIAYYDNYVNKETGFYSIADWVAEQENDEAVRNLYLEGDYYESTNDIMMFEAICNAKFLNECQNVEGLELIETTEYIVSGVTSAYAIPLNCDGKEGLTAVFDAEGNLLNIRVEPDDWEYTYTFE